MAAPFARHRGHRRLGAGRTPSPADRPVVIEGWTCAILVARECPVEANNKEGKSQQKLSRNA
jgi:hypothetical protein